MNTFHLTILATNKNFFDGECTSMTVPTSDGLYGIMAHHENLIASLEPGLLTFKKADGVERVAVVSHGFIKVQNNKVNVFAATVEKEEDIDEVRARKALESARRKLLQKANMEEYMSAQARISRALARLKASERGRRR